MAKSAFKGKAEDTGKLAMLTPQQYYQLLEQLVTEGNGRGKTANVTAFKVDGVKIRTLTNTGEREVDRVITTENVYICFDQEKWPRQNQLATKLAIEDMGRQWGRKIAAANTAGEDATIEDVEALVKEILDKPDLEKAGVYVLKGNAFGEDYIATAVGSSDYIPNPQGTRVILRVSEDVNIPAPWGGDFLVRSGGAVAVRERAMKEGETQGHLPELLSALSRVKAGEKPEDVLYGADGKPKFDVYGMHPGFDENNYADVPLKRETDQARAVFACQKQKTKLITALTCGLVK